MPDHPIDQDDTDPLYPIDPYCFHPPRPDPDSKYHLLRYRAIDFDRGERLVLNEQHYFHDFVAGANMGDADPRDKEVVSVAKEMEVAATEAWYSAAVMEISIPFWSLDDEPSNEDWKWHGLSGKKRILEVMRCPKRLVAL